VDVVCLQDVKRPSYWHRMDGKLISTQSNESELLMSTRADGPRLGRCTACFHRLEIRIRSIESIVFENSVNFDRSSQIYAEQ
jgi:hypothetical protein